MVGSNDGVKDDEGSKEIEGKSDGGFDDVGNDDGDSVAVRSSSGCKTTVELGESDDNSPFVAGGAGSSSGEGCPAPVGFAPPWAAGDPVA